MPNFFDLHTLEENISQSSFYLVASSAGILIALTIISLLLKKANNSIKVILFFSIAAVTLFTTIYLAGTTIYLNQVSVSGGPVHYHADIEFYACGQELNLKEPEGFSNKIGTPTLHEHNDKRIHLEGVVVQESDRSLGKFMDVIGGGIDSSYVSIPTTDGLKSYQTGINCPDQENSQVQVFVYQTREGIYTQSKITNPYEYLISPESQVPTGDCIIVEFDTAKEKTDQLCLSYKVAEQLQKVQKGL